jgi:proteasome accessory factor B
MHNVIERILNLLAFLLTVGRPVTADEIRHTVKGYDQPGDEAFRRTFERDKDLLRSLGVPLQTTPTDIWEVEIGYIVPSDAYTLDDPGFTDEERSALLIAAETVRFGGKPTELAAIFKLGGATGDPVPGPVTADLGQDLASLGALFQAVSERRHVEFEYRSRTRRVAPYGLVHRFGHWYLVGPETGDTDLVKAFRVDRMRSISPHDLTHAFERPDDFDPGSALAGVETPQASHTALVRLDNDVANVAVGRWRTARVVEGDESTTLVEIPFDTDFAVINWVLGFDARAEIVEPVALRERLIEYVGTGR